MPRKSRAAKQDVFDQVSGEGDVFDYLDRLPQGYVLENQQRGQVPEGFVLESGPDTMPSHTSGKAVAPEFQGRPDATRQREVTGISSPRSKVFKTPEETRQAAGELAGTAIDATMGVSDAVTLGLSKPLTDEARKEMPEIGLTPNPVAKEAGKFAGFVIPFAAAHKVISIGAEALTGLAGAVETAGTAGRIATAATTGGTVGYAMKPEGGETRASNALELAAVGAGFQSVAEFIPFIESAVSNSDWWRKMNIKERGLILRTPEAMREAGFPEEEIAKIEIPLAQQARNNPEVFRKLQAERMQTEQPRSEAPVEGPTTAPGIDAKPVEIANGSGEVPVDLPSQAVDAARGQEVISPAGSKPEAQIASTSPTITEAGGGDVFDTIHPDVDNSRAQGESVTVLQSSVLPGAKELIDKDVIPAMKQGRQIVKESLDHFRGIFTPASRTEEAQQTAFNLRELGSRRARTLDQIETAIEPARQYFDKEGPVSDINSRSYDFITKIEKGEIDALPRIERPFAKLNYEIFDNLLREVQQRGKFEDVKASSEKLESGSAGEDFLTYYFPRLWKNPEKSQTVIMELLSKRPFEGRKSFLKKRTIELFEEGIAAGLQPAYDNPMDFIYHKASEMTRWIMARDFMNAEKAAGRLTFVPAGSHGPDGRSR